MFIAYFDESGTHKESNVVVVAGYVSTDQQWYKFSEEWQSTLNDYNLDCFHMTDFENHRKQFAGMPESDHRRLLERLIAFIRIRQRIAVGVTFDIADYNEVVQEFPDMPLKQPYAFCAIVCIGRVRAWLKKHNYNEQVDYVYESGAEHQGQVLSAYNYALKNADLLRLFRIRSLAFGSKRELPPLQAADILAYETWKEVSNTIAGRPRAVRWPMAQLAKAPMSGLRIQKDMMKAMMLNLRTQAKTGYITIEDDGF